jgi:conjugal transfer pilus assembly protein TraD
VLEPEQLAAHGLVLGASGAGKSTTLLRLLTERIRDGGPAVAVDLKGSPAFARALAEAARAAGRPLQLWSLDGPGRWNPLAHGNPTELKDKLIGAERFSEPHYQRAAERYLQAALTTARALHPERAPTLAEVVALTEPRRLAAQLRGVREPLRSQVRDYLSSLTPDQLSAVRGAGTRLALLTESAAGRYLAPAPGVPAIDLPAALQGGPVVLFSLNASRYGALAAQVGTMVVQDLVTAAGARLERPGPRALVAIDEFSALGGQQVVALLARGRESGVSVVLATQELADLERAGAGVREQVLGNTALKVIHRQDVPGSATLAAQLAGTEWVWEETRQFGARPRGAGPGPRGTRREVERFRVHPNAIRTLCAGEALLITKIPASDVQLVRVLPARAMAAGAPTSRDAAAARGAPGPAAAAPAPAAAAPARPSAAAPRPSAPAPRPPVRRPPSPSREGPER